MKRTSSTKPTRRSTNKNLARKPTESHARVVAAARSAVRQAIKAHKVEGQPIVVWRSGKVVLVPASEIK